ncbi:hypothetical protein ACOMHN_061501 [Nucella lapillus]
MTKAPEAKCHFPGAAKYHSQHSGGYWGRSDVTPRDKITVITERSSQNGHHRTVITERSSQNGHHRTVITERSSQNGHHRTVITERSSQNGHHDVEWQSAHDVSTVITMWNGSLHRTVITMWNGSLHMMSARSSRCGMAVCT